MSEEQTVILSPLCASTSRTQHNLAPRKSSTNGRLNMLERKQHPVVLKPHVHCFQKKLSYSFIAKKQPEVEPISSSSHHPILPWS